MKRLLHSKVFRKNLYNWLFMYITVIGLFTSVVTYSKYISSFQNNTKAKVAKFDASITYDGICSQIEENEICNAGSFRPVSKINFYFTVDTTNLEVSTIFVTRISVKDKFKNVKIYDITDVEKLVDDFVVSSNSYVLTENLKVDKTYVRKYKVTMEYDYQTYDNDHSEEHLLGSVLTVGYSATQVK